MKFVLATAGLVVVSTLAAGTLWPDKSLTDEEYTRLVSLSDDLDRYAGAFEDATRYLIEVDVCDSDDFEETGGWIKSQIHRNRPIYFTYCGNFSHVSGRIYFNARTYEFFGRADGIVPW